MATSATQKPESDTENERGLSHKNAEELGGRVLAEDTGDRVLQGLNKQPADIAQQAGQAGAGQAAAKGAEMGAKAASQGANAASAAKKGAEIPSLPKMPEMPQGPGKKAESPEDQNPLQMGGEAVKAGGQGIETTGKGLETAGKVGEGVGKAVGAIPTPATKAAGGTIEGAGKVAKYAGKGVKKVGEGTKAIGEKLAEKGREAAEEGEQPGGETPEEIEAEAAKAAEKGAKKVKRGCCVVSLITGLLGPLGCGTIAIILFICVIVVPVLLITSDNEGGTSGTIAGNTYLNQGDPPWGSQVYCGSYGTIGQTGCTVTTGAMALRSIGIDTDPEQLAQKLCPARGSWGFGVAGQQAAASFYGVKLVQVNSESELIQAVSAGHAVGIYADPAGDISTHGSPHSVLVIGISGNQMTVMDPSDNNGRGKSKQENVTRTCSLSSWTGASSKWGYYYIQKAAQK